MPELVEKYEPPTITKIKKNIYRLFGTSDSDIPIFETLLVIDNKIIKKL